MSYADELLNQPSVAERMLESERKKSIFDYLFAPRHKLKRREKHLIKVVKKEKHSVEEYYP